MVKAVKIQRSVILEEEIINEIQEIADKQERSFSSMLNILLREILDRKKR